MTRGGKNTSINKQIRQEHHIEEDNEERGVSEKESQRRAWATENKMSGGGQKKKPSS